MRSGLPCGSGAGSNAGRCGAEWSVARRWPSVASSSAHQVVDAGDLVAETGAAGAVGIDAIDALAKGHGDFAGGHVDRYNTQHRFVGAYAGFFQSEAAVWDLAHDPDDYADADVETLAARIGWASSEPIKPMRLNAQPYACPMEVPSRAYFDGLPALGEEEWARRAQRLKALGRLRQKILQAMQDLRQVGVDFLTLGQYLQPTRKHLKVEQYLTPETFEKLAEEGLRMGFDYVASGPLVRSSYRAAEFYIERKIRGEA